jgi:hypothetical protein
MLQFLLVEGSELEFKKPFPAWLPGETASLRSSVLDSGNYCVPNIHFFSTDATRCLRVRQAGLLSRDSASSGPAGNPHLYKSFIAFSLVSPAAANLLWC